MGKIRKKEIRIIDTEEDTEKIRFFCNPIFWNDAMV